MKHVPTDRPYDFSKELFPLLLEMGRPIYGHVFDGYWQDIGNLDQFRQANIDALDERVRLKIPGIRIRGNIWLGDGVTSTTSTRSRARPTSGTTAASRVARASARTPPRVERHRARAESRRPLDGRHLDLHRPQPEVEGAIIGRGCDIRAHVRIHEGAAIGDEVTIGAESVILPGVRIYPSRT